MSYRLPPNETTLHGACAVGGGVCVWTGRAAYRWRPDAAWTALSPAPTAIDSGFPLQSGLLAGASTHVGFLPTDASEWAWWADLSAFSDAHPMYGDLLLCTDRDANTTYHLFSIGPSGLTRRSRVAADALAAPVAGWSAPTNAERLLLLGDGGLWALGPPYSADDRQHLVSFDDVALPALEDIPGPFQPGVATVVIPRRTRTALRLDLSDGSGHATGLKHLPGGAALWSAYLNNDETAAARLLNTLAALPPPASADALRLHAFVRDDATVRAVATSAGLFVPDAPPPDTPVSASPLDSAALATWALWLAPDDAVDTACRLLHEADDPVPALAESLRLFVGPDACDALAGPADAAPPAEASES
jgi:hypothetical protein